MDPDRDPTLENDPSVAEVLQPLKLKPNPFKAPIRTRVRPHSKEKSYQCAIGACVLPASGL